MKLSHNAGEKLSVERRLILFDLALGGHHGSYIQNLVEYWCNQGISGSLNIVVLPEFIQLHSDTVDMVSKRQHPHINFVTVTSEEEAALKSRNSFANRTFRNFQEWNLFCKYAASLKATQSLIMYFDTCELPLAVGMKSPCPFSGIYFRPTFHYSDFTDYAPSRKDKLQQQRERFTLARILRHPQLKTLFCLDPFAVKHTDQFHSKVNVVHLPDPVQIHHEYEFQLDSLKESLGIHPGRRVFLLFGALDGRKGIYQLLEAIALLPSELCQKLCLVFVGATNAVEQALIQPKVAAICKAQPVQIVEYYKFVPEQNVAAYFHLADAVLAPYQQHVGMSGILLLAAAAQKPVLSSNYGLMGELVKSYSLGLTVNSTLPSEIAQGLTQLLLKPLEKICDFTKMKTLVEQNYAEQFAKVIFQHL